ncbi:hypothetical protein Tco_0661762 [Tanacetum coccineum]
MSNQTNELKNKMASFFQMNTASSSDGPTIPMPYAFINPEEDERVEETLTDPDHSEYTIKVPPPQVQKAKHLSQRNFVIHQRDPRYPHIPYPSRMNQEKQKEKDEVQIHKFWQMFKQLHINISLADALILILKYQKMLKSLISNKEKLIELQEMSLFWLESSHSPLILSLSPSYHDNQLSGNPTPISEPETKSSSSPTLISLEESDLIWEEFEAYLTSDLFPLGNSNPLSLLPPFHNSLSGSTTSSLPSLHISEISDYFLEEFADELTHITFLPGNNDLTFDAESDLRELKYLLNHDPIKDMDSILEDSVEEISLDDNLDDTISEMFTDEHALDYSS